MQTTLGTAHRALRRHLDGELYAPQDADYDEARAAWNLNADQRPALVVMAESPGDVVAAVRFAAAEGLGVGVMATGHGVGRENDGGVLVNTSRMKGVRVDPAAMTARVEAGAKWADVVPLAAEHGLAGLVGSTSDVGVVGYTMGGGFGWLGRKYGFAAHSVLEAEIVTASGELLRANERENPDLFWGLRGGGGNLGIVTSLTFRLYPLSRGVFGGNLFYPLERAREVVELYARWSREMTEEMTSAVAFLNLPPLPEIPEPLRGGSFVLVRGAYSGEDPSRGEELLAPWRELGAPVMDTFSVMPVSAMDAISMDPVDPGGAYVHTEMLRDLTPEVIETLLKLAEPGAASPIALIEVRQVGGALARGAGMNTMGGGAGYNLHAVGPTPFPELDGAVRSHLEHLAESLRPHATGATYLNFLDLYAATPERVAAAYSPDDLRRLRDLKARHDPRNVFRFNRNIAPDRRRGLEAGGSRQGERRYG